MAGLTLLSNHCASFRPSLYFMLLLICFVTAVLVMIVTDPYDHYNSQYTGPTPVKQNNSKINVLKHSSLLMTNASMTQTTSLKRTRNPLLERDRLSGLSPILSLNYSHVKYALAKKTNASMTQTTSRKRTRNPLLERDRLSGLSPILSLNYSHVNYNLAKKKLLVLMWSPFLSVFNTSDQPEVCEYIYDHDKIQQADFVFFTSISSGDLKEIAPSRIPSQRWVIHTRESVQNGYFKDTFLANVANLFNFSSHYSTRGDIHFPYGWCEDSYANDDSRWPPFPNKTGLVFWIASHCHTISKREDYVQRLRKYIQVDTYGHCGNHAMPRNKNNQCGSSCQKYKFYLSFENSFCSEYVTEKLYKIISDDSLYVIPIVMGLDDYDMLPKDAIIDVRDFRSPRLLAEHLQYLNKNNTAFMKYFEWRNKRKCFKNTINPMAGAVTLCDSLWKIYTTFNVTSVLQADKLFETYGNQNCVTADEFYHDFLLD